MKHLQIALAIMEAKDAHVASIQNILIQSITTNCFLDHQNDPAAISHWLANKTTENIVQWIKVNYTLIALNNNEHVGVAMISKVGEILLNYVLPEYISKGIGKSMLNEMERFAKKSELKEIMIISTITAIPFYKRNGFIENKMENAKDGINMKKALEY